MRNVKVFKRDYQGKYYLPIDESIDSFKDRDIDSIRFHEVGYEDLIVGSEYIVSNGSTIKFLGDGAYSISERSPLRGAFNVESLNENCVRLFWTLVKNCKNGTYFGV